MKIKIILPGYAILVISCISLSAQNFKAEYDSARVYIQKNNFSEAIPWLEKARQSAKTPTLDTNAYTETVKLLSVAYARTKKLPEAEAAFKESIDLYAKNSNKKNPLAAALLNFGIFYYNQAKYKEALPIFERALSVKSEISPSTNPDYLSILYSLANCQTQLKMYPVAEENLLKLLKLRVETVGMNHQDYLNTANALAQLYRSTQRTEKAIEIHLEILESVKALKGEQSKEYANQLFQVATLYKEIFQLDKADKYFFLAHDSYLKLYGERHQDYAKVLIQCASISRMLGKYTQAEPLYIKSQNLVRELWGEISAEYAALLNNLALFYSETGKYDVAESSYKYAIEISRQTIGEKHPETATTYSNLGLLYKSLGRYDQAEPMFKKAQKYRKDILGEKHPDYAAILNNIAGVYEATGKYSEAETLYQQSLKILKETSGEMQPDYAATLNNLAGVLEGSKKFAQAEPLYRKSLEIIKNIYGEQHPDYSATLNNLALLLEATGKKADAESMFKQNLDVVRNNFGEQHPTYATALHNYALLLQTMARYYDAEKFLTRALQIRKDILGEQNPAYASTLYELAKISTAMGNYNQAGNYWDKALGNYLYQINTFFPTMSEKEKGKFYQTINAKFEQFNTYALLTHRINPSILGKMYDYQLATKALLLNSTQKMKQRILSSGDFMLIEKYKKWNAQKELLTKAASMSVDEQKAAGISVAELTAITNELEKELNASSELFRNANENKNITWRNIQQKLKPDEAAIEMVRFIKFHFDSSGYYRVDSVFYAALIVTAQQKNAPELVLIKNGMELEKQYLKYYRNAIKNKTDDEFGYSQYWSRIRKAVPNAKKIYFSPDGVYNSINLNALYNTQTKQFVWDEVDIQTVTNTKDILSSKPAATNVGKKIALIGSPDFAITAKLVASTAKGVPQEQLTFIERAGSGLLSPLPGTKVEVEKIAGMLSTQQWYSEIYTEQNATEENLKKQESPKILHIATHGFFEQDATTVYDKNKRNKEADGLEDNPLLKSGLMLAGASLTLLKRKNESVNLDIKTDATLEDGILTAYEAMNLNLDKTDLVVLSACETGLGEVKNGEGVYGLQRAFMVAGAKALIFSLWTVNDAATQKLMTTFYQEMLKPNVSVRQAFRNAQATLRKEHPHPYFWGAFVLVGE